LNSEIDALFALPLDDFTAARNMLAARLKKEGRTNDAARVKALLKPPVSAWAVNQLYWRHREVFDRLLAAGKEFRTAQASQLSGKAAHLRESQDARRKSLRELSDLAAELLQKGGHNAGPETLRRVRTTLEAISASASGPDGPYPGRLTADVDPPGFDALAALVSDIPKTKERKSVSGAASIAEAKSTVRHAEQALKQARAIARTAGAARQKAAAVKKQAEKLMREADERLKAATSEADEAARAVDEAERALTDASRKLQSLLQGHGRPQSISGGRRTNG
jgi:hypothetical protein